MRRMPDHFWKKLIFVGSLCTVAIWVDAIHLLDGLLPYSSRAIENALLVFLSIEVLVLLCGEVFLAVTFFTLSVGFFLDAADRVNPKHAEDAKRLRDTLSEISMFALSFRGEATFIRSDLQNLNELSERLLERMVEVEKKSKAKRSTQGTGDHELTREVASDLAREPTRRAEGEIDHDPGRDHDHDRDDFGLEL